KGQNDRPSNIGACNTASWPLNINPTDEANAPLIYAAISAKCSDDGHRLHRVSKPAGFVATPAGGNHGFRSIT
ncbi:MAG: hypothetical protein K9G27_08910, partial [Sphingomonadaceae bacterium]|nr:hypothetical protein [Sphingomonadaceae bacterium]